MEKFWAKWTHREMSKRILYVIGWFCWCVTISVIIQSFVYGGTEALTALVGGVSGAASVSIGFYYWKAKNENMRKFDKKSNPDDSTDDSWEEISK